MKLQVQDESAVVKMCQAIEIDKELKEGSEMIIAHVMLAEAKEEENTLVPREITEVLPNLADVFPYLITT